MISDMSNKPIRSLMAGILLLSLAACGGGGGSSGNKGTTVSGTASAPGGSVAMFEEQSILKLAGNFLMSAANAEITGLQPVTGATVELIEINNDGNQVGEVLASTQTSITGDYQLKLPAGIDFAANLVLRITSADETQTLDAQVLTKTVNIDPYSDYLLDKLVENGTQLDTLATNEVLLLKGKLEEFDLTAGANLEEMFAALEEATGEFMDESIETVNNGDGDATTVAGDYHFGEFAFSLHDSDDDPFGTFSTEVVFQSLNLSAGEGENINATFDNTRLDSWYNLLYINEGNHQLQVEDTIENIPEQESAKVDGIGALIFEGEFEEEIQDCDDPNPEQNCFGWRFPAFTARLEPLNNTGLYIGRFIDAGVRYHLTQDKVLDPNNKSGDEIFYTLALLGEKGTNLSDASLNGLYGMVGIDATATNTTGVTDIFGFYGQELFDGAGNITEQMFDGYNISRASNMSPTVSSDTTTADFTYSVSSDGTLVFTDGQENDSGFVSSDGNAFALFIHDTSVDSTNTSVIAEANNGMVFGVKLPASTPSMAGKEYRLFNMMFGYGNRDSSAATTLSSLSDAVLTFNSGSTVTLRADNSRGIERPNDNSNLEAFVETLGTIAENSATNIGNNGDFSTTLTLPDGETLTIDGFIAASGELIAFRTIYIDGATRELGIFIGSLIE